MFAARVARFAGGKIKLQAGVSLSLSIRGWRLALSLLSVAGGTQAFRSINGICRSIKSLMRDIIIALLIIGLVEQAGSRYRAIAEH